ncbi:TIGR02450 family Trp-rich protein [Pseudomonas sp. RIT-PI-AD]|uniref:TIGR02450 family Trp-rich protein n=1 Tax=Pseudomonas sp. RIT-PI-AD TaxID=3035294 RepID=UPI0021DB64CF|nr:TIGR02450 family Trp-rich protein [Pseudomonas sp. RIT-PI-AD]
MRRLDPRKLLLSKWTATLPRQREKHFLVTELFHDEEGVLREIELQAVLTRRSQRLDWRALRDDAHWRIGWR